MCKTHIFSDRYPDGQIVTFRQLKFCENERGGRPCLTHHSVEEPLRNINFDELTTEQVIQQERYLARPRIYQPIHREHTPPRSPHSHHRHSSSESTSSHRHRSKKSHHSPLRPTRQHRKERIIIVDSPPTPRTPPQIYNQTFTAPSSPASPIYMDSNERGRPIIVDERPLRRRNTSTHASISDRYPTPRDSRDQSRSRPWDSPSTSHTSFNSRLRLEAEELARAREREEERQIRKDIEDRKRERALRREQDRHVEFARRDEEIRARPSVPLAPMPPRRQAAVVEQVDPESGLVYMMGGLGIEDSEEAMKRRLRERQMPKRRFSVGPGFRRERDGYAEGLYRYE